MTPMTGPPMERQTLTCSAGQKFSVRVVRSRGEWNRNAIVLLPAIAGVNDYVEEVARQLASHGYSVVAIDYFSRERSTPDLSSPERIGAAVAALDDRQVLREVIASTAWLESEGFSRQAIGILGFCIGGTYAVLAAAEQEYGCAVAYYGQLSYPQKTPFKPVDPIQVAERLRAPVLGHFGEKDRLISAAEITTFSHLLWSSPLAHELHTYAGAPHAFDEWFRPQVYRAVASAQAWNRTLIFLDWHLRRQTPRRSTLAATSNLMETHHDQEPRIRDHAL